MTGPEHYRQAEQILAEAENSAPDANCDDVALLLKFAQVHATLALAAATALNDYPEGAPIADIRAWRATAGTPEDGAR
jgi:hypothetical protein